VDRTGRLAQPVTAWPDNRKQLALELAALALIVAAHVVLLTRLLDTRAFFDEGVYLLSLEELRHGAALGREVFSSQVPGFYLVLQALAPLYGVSLTGMRLGIVTIDVLGVVFAYLIARRVSGPLGGLLAAALIAVSPVLPRLGGRIFADPVAMVLVLAAIWLALIRRPIGAGVVFAGAMLVKLTAITAAPTLIVLLALERPGRWRRLVEAAAGAAALVAVLAILYARDLSGIWKGAFGYHLDTRDVQGLSGTHELSDYWYTSLHALYMWITVAGIAASVLVWRRVWPYWLWPALGVLFILWYQPLRPNHTILLPYAFALPLAIALALVAQRLSRRGLTVAVGAAVVVLGAAWIQQLRTDDEFRVPEDAAIVAAADRLASLTSPDDLVIVDQPMVAFLADRRVPPQLVDTAESRLQSGSLTVDDVLEAVDDDSRVTAALAGRAFSTRPELIAGFERRFAARLDVEAGAIFYGRR
jgi:4-amino-4-deoxy-L-arabinose transferase-like glycosyltransferase